MTRWFIGLLACALATCQPSRADVTTYSGALYGTVSAVPVAAAVEIQLDGTPAVGATVKARARLTSDPLGYPISRDWSRWYTAAISGQPFRANVDLPDLRGRLGVDWTASNITVAADGAAGGFALAVPPQRLAMSFVAPVQTNNTATQPTNAATGRVDVLDVSRIRIIGKHQLGPARARVVSTMSKARIEGGNVRIAYEPVNWPSKTGSNGKTTDGGVCIVWPDGDGYVGGWFDHHGRGQTVKTLGNIPGGYVDGRQPAKGSPVWFYMISYDGRERTTICPGGTW